MTPTNSKRTYFHLAGIRLEPGSVIMPGNWGRVIRAIGWNHSHALREYALEQARQARFAHRPSRLESCFGFLSAAEATVFQQRTQGFQFHILYQVELTRDEGVFVTDSRLCAPQGNLRVDWADVYWEGADYPHIHVSGMDWQAATQGLPLPEMLTTSPLVVIAQPGA